MSTDDVTPISQLEPRRFLEPPPASCLNLVELYITCSGTVSLMQLSSWKSFQEDAEEKEMLLGWNQ